MIFEVLYRDVYTGRMRSGRTSASGCSPTAASTGRGAKLKCQERPRRAGVERFGHFVTQLGPTWFLGQEEHLQEFAKFMSIFRLVGEEGLEPSKSDDG